MANIFQFELLSPERLLFSEVVENVILPGSGGYLTVMTGHSPMIIRIIPGLIHVKIIDGTEHVFVVFGGFADIRPEICSLLVESAVPIDTFESQDVECRIAKLREDFELAKSDEQRNKAEDLLYQMIALQDIHEFPGKI